MAIELTKLFQTELEHYEKLEGARLSLEGKANHLAAMVRNVAQLLAVARFQDAATELVMQRIAKGDNLVRESGILLRPAFWQARRDPRIMELFNQTGHAQYWLETNHWPDYCEAPDLPYDCESLAKSLPAL